MKKKRLLLGIVMLGVVLLANIRTISVFAEETSIPTKQEIVAESLEEGEVQQDGAEVAEAAQTVYTDDSLVRITTAELILICLLAVIILVEIVASTIIIVLILKRPRGFAKKEDGEKEGGKEHE